MKQGLYAIKDSIVGFGQPFVAPNKFAAIRGFNDTINDRGGYLNKHPENFDLYQIGTFEDDSGIVTSNVEFIEKGLNLLKNETK